jgi:hypothetical protein
MLDRFVFIKLDFVKLMQPWPINLLSRISPNLNFVGVRFSLDIVYYFSYTALQ